MKRYWVFKGHTYYPYGGMEDFYQSYDEEDVAIEEAKNLGWGEWSHVYDSTDEVTIFEGSDL